MPSCWMATERDNNVSTRADVGPDGTVSYFCSPENPQYIPDGAAVPVIGR